MKNCPICRQSPLWHYCRNVSRKHGGNFYLIEGCSHAETFAKPFAFVAHAERAVFEEKWDAEAERLFAEYTARWTDPQRVSYRIKVFPTALPSELPLLEPAQIQQAKAWNEAHPASDEDN
jgi:hypothetical protein